MNTSAIKRVSSLSRTSEKNIERHLVDGVRFAGGVCLKFASSTETGWPDRLVLLPGGRAAWCELKSAGQRPTQLQTLRLEELRRMGFTAEVCDSREKVDAFIETICRL